MALAAISDPDLFFELIRRAPLLEALRDGPLDRAELERRLDVSRATSHRATRSLGDLGLIERRDGLFGLTATGAAVTEAVLSFTSRVDTALRLAPVLEAVDDTAPVPLDAFADATVTTPRPGDPHSPMVRYVSLVRETDRLRGFNTWAIAPTYMGEIQLRILDGMETELIDPVPVVEDVMDNYPERCVQVCASGNLAIRLHDALPFALAIFDDRIGVGVLEPDTNALRAFVDTDAPAAREWAESAYAAYETDSVVLAEFTKRGLRKARLAA